MHIRSTPLVSIHQTALFSVHTKKNTFIFHSSISICHCSLPFMAAFSSISQRPRARAAALARRGGGRPVRGLPAGPGLRTCLPDMSRPQVALQAGRIGSGSGELRCQPLLPDEACIDRAETATTRLPLPPPPPPPPSRRNLPRRQARANAEPPSPCPPLWTPSPHTVPCAHRRFRGRRGGGGGQRDGTGSSD